MIGIVVGCSLFRVTRTASTSAIWFSRDEMFKFLLKSFSDVILKFWNTSSDLLAGMLSSLFFKAINSKSSSSSLISTSISSFDWELSTNSCFLIERLTLPNSWDFLSSHDCITRKKANIYKIFFIKES